MRMTAGILGAGILLLLMGCTNSADYIKPYENNPSYWEYNGKPILLIGGSVEDNLFQVPDLENQLNLLQEAGGNYVRCTMSSRDEGNVWPFDKDQDSGLYDLNQPNPEYWGRFKQFLDLTSQRGIIAQIELWATFDYYRNYWDVNPFNPKNNINYTSEESGLPEKVTTHPTQTDNPFFWSVPAEHDNQLVLKYQQQYIDHLLSISLKYGNVLYCMDNETAVTPEWGAYWARYIQQRAKRQGVPAETTEMWDPWDLSNPMHTNTFDHPEIYTFVDVSQNNHQSGQTHWDNAQLQRKRVAGSGHIRPLNNVKVYGANTGNYGSDQDGMARMWRNVWGGMAASRFHRPDAGLGLSEKARANIHSLRMITDSMNVFESEPHNEVLVDREADEAYCLAQPGKKYAIFFPDGGEVHLKLSSAQDQTSWRVHWLDILHSRWGENEIIQGKSELPLETPSRGLWAVLIQPNK